MLVYLTSETTKTKHGIQIVSVTIFNSVKDGTSTSEKRARLTCHTSKNIIPFIFFAISSRTTLVPFPNAIHTFMIMNLKILMQLKITKSIDIPVKYSLYQFCITSF